MAKLERKHQRIYGEDAHDDELGVIGSRAAEAPDNTRDIERMQSLREYLEGYFSMTIVNKDTRLPASEDLNSLFHLTTRQIAYLMQAGIPEWNAETEYYVNSFVQFEGEVYRAIRGTDADVNIGNAPPSASFWDKPFDHSDIEAAIDANVQVAQTDIQDIKAKDLLGPVGSTYIQFPGTLTPSLLLPRSTWLHISSSVSGSFIRFEGGRASSFGGGKQSHAFQAHKHYLFSSVDALGSYGIKRWKDYSVSGKYGLGAGFSYSMQSVPFGAADVGLSSNPVSNVSTNAYETRPDNYTVRLWKRTA